MTPPGRAATPHRTDVCAVGALLPERAVAALVDGRQVAIVAVCEGDVYVVGQFDPFCGANVMSRGLVGSTLIDGVDVPTIQSPMYKQAFDLRTGLCVSDPSVCLGSWAVEVRDGRVVVGAMTRASSGLLPQGGS